MAAPLDERIRALRQYIKEYGLNDTAQQAAKVLEHEQWQQLQDASSLNSSQPSIPAGTPELWDESKPLTKPAGDPRQVFVGSPFDDPNIQRLKKAALADAFEKSSTMGLVSDGQRLDKQLGIPEAYVPQAFGPDAPDMQQAIGQGRMVGNLAGNAATLPAQGALWGGASKLAAKGLYGLGSQLPGALLENSPKLVNALARGSAPLGQHVSDMLKYELGAMPVRETIRGVNPKFAEEHPWLTEGAAMAVSGGLSNPEALMRIKGLKGAFGNERGAVQVPLRQPGEPTLWQKTGGKALMKGVDKIVDMPLTPQKGPFKGVSKTLGGNTLRQWFIHPMDRMAPSAGKAFQDTIVSKQQTQEALGSLAVGMKDLNLEERMQVMKVLKTKSLDWSTLPSYLQDKLGPAFEQVKSAVASSTRRIASGPKEEIKMMRDLTKGVSKIFTANVDDPSFPIYRDVAKQNGYDLTTVKGTRKFLEYLSESAEPEPVTKLASDLLRISSKTGEELARVTKGTYERALVRRVKNSPWVRPRRSAVDIAKHGKYPDDGYKWISMHDRMESRALRQLKGQEVREDVAEGFLDFEKTYSQARAIYNTYFLAPWKTAKVLWNPAARVRDLTSNFIFNDVAGKHPLSIFNVKHYTKALVDMKKGSPEFRQFLEETGGSFQNLMNIDPGPVLQSLKTHGSMPGAILSMIYDPTKNLGLKGLKGEIANKVVNAPAKYTHFMADKARFADAWAKYAKYKWNVGKGMESKEAAMDALRTVGDHNRQTQAVKFVRDWAMPFAGWQAHAIKTMGWGMINHPVRTGKYFALPWALQQIAVDKLNMTEADWNYFKGSLPDYVKEDVSGVPTHIPLPFRDEKGRIQMMDISWWIPGLQDLGELHQSVGSVTGVIQNPALSLFAALKDNKTFSGAPLYYEWEAPSIKAKKTLAYIWQQMSPSFVPGGHVWEKVARVGDADPQAPTAGQAAGSMVGWRVHGYDPGASIESLHNKLDIYERQARAMMEKELQRAGSDTKRAAAAIKSYQDTMGRIAKQRVGE